MNNMLLVWTTSLYTSPMRFICVHQPYALYLCVCVRACVRVCVRGHEPIVRRDTIERRVT